MFTEQLTLRLGCGSELFQDFVQPGEFLSLNVFHIPCLAGDRCTGCQAPLAMHADFHRSANVGNGRAFQRAGVHHGKPETIALHVLGRGPRRGVRLCFEA